MKPALTLTADAQTLLERLGVPRRRADGTLHCQSPITGETIGKVSATSPAEVKRAVSNAHAAYLRWRGVPAPVRGEVIRLFADELRRYKSDLGRLVSIEVGKIISEGLGEVQEMIDLCDLALGLSRQLHGL